jgi:hypothetical protein
MKLIQIDNTLYIVEGKKKYKVSEKSKKELTIIAHYIWGEKVILCMHKFEYHLKQGVDITDIKHRIEIVKKYAQQQYSEVEIEYYEAVLLPEKEDELKELLEIVDKKTYSIEQIEKAIEEYFNSTIYRTEHIKKGIINNLTK